MATVEVDFNVDKFKRELRSFTRRQVPFASSLALNMTMYDTLDELRDELPKHFTIRSSWTARGFVPSHRASKTEQWATWGHRDDFMLRQAEGGTKQHAKGRVAVPVKARRTERSRITPRSFPAAFEKRGAFERNGALYIPVGGRRKRRRGKSGRRLKMLYVFSTSIQVPQRYPFDDIVERTVARLWPQNMQHAWNRALRR